MKLQEILDRFEAGQFSDELVAEFRKALRRVHGAFLKTQHCYLAAYSMPVKCYLESIALIRMGLEEYAGDDHDRMRCWEQLGNVSERAGDYPAARRAFQEALRIARESDCELVRRDSEDNLYAAFFARCLMRVEKLANGYTYTPALREYYELAQQDDILMLLTAERFDQSLTESIIHEHDGSPEQASAARECAKVMLDENYEGPWTALLARKGYQDSPRATAQALEYLRGIHRSL